MKTLALIVLFGIASIGCGITHVDAGPTGIKVHGAVGCGWVKGCTIRSL